MSEKSDLMHFPKVNEELERKIEADKRILHILREKNNTNVKHEQ